MKHQFTAWVMPDEDWFIAYCEEVPSANGQGRTRQEALESLTSAIELLFECYREDLQCDLLPGAEKTTVVVG